MLCVYRIPRLGSDQIDTKSEYPATPVLKREGTVIRAHVYVLDVNVRYCLQQSLTTDVLG